MKVSSAAAAAMLACTLTLAALPAQAQNARSFVSSKGLDTNACTLTAPCRTFQRAHDATNAKGEIDVLDTAGYGPVTITKSISIINDGTGTASLVPPVSGKGILVAAGANDKVRLRGLTIDGSGNAGSYGIYFQSGAALTIENCVARRNYIGIYLATTSAFFTIVDSSASDNSAVGILAAGPGGTIARTQATGNQTGIVAQSTDSFTITSVDASGNNADGIDAFGGAVLFVRDSTLTKNGATGLYVSSNSRAFLTRNLIASNHTGIDFATGSTFSYGDNAINWNTNDLLAGSSLTSVPLR